MDKENLEPKRKCLKLYKSSAKDRRHVKAATMTVSPSKRFSHVSANELTYLSENANPKNTDQNTKWSLKNFNTWKDHHNSFSGEKCLDDLLEEANPELLNKWLSTFIMETRREDGQPYPPKTLDNILSGLLRYTWSRPLKDPPNFLSKDDPRFQKLLVTHDNVYKSLRVAGVGAETKVTATISKEKNGSALESGASRYAQS